MFKIPVFLVTVALFAGFVVLTLPLAAGEWMERRLAGRLQAGSRFLPAPRA